MPYTEKLRAKVVPFSGFRHITVYYINNENYYMAESVFAMRLVNLLSVTCYTDQNFKENAHFGALNPFTSEKKIEIKLQDVYQP